MLPVHKRGSRKHKKIFKFIKKKCCELTLYERNINDFIIIIYIHKKYNADFSGEDFQQLEFSWHTLASCDKPLTNLRYLNGTEINLFDIYIKLLAEMRNKWNSLQNIFKISRPKNISITTIIFRKKRFMFILLLKSLGFLKVKSLIKFQYNKHFIENLQALTIKKIFVKIFTMPHNKIILVDASYKIRNYFFSFNKQLMFLVKFMLDIYENFPTFYVSKFAYVIKNSNYFNNYNVDTKQITPILTKYLKEFTYSIDLTYEDDKRLVFKLYFPNRVLWNKTRTKLSVHYLFDDRDLIQMVGYLPTFCSKVIYSLRFLKKEIVSVSIIMYYTLRLLNDPELAGRTNRLFLAYYNYLPIKESKFNHIIKNVSKLLNTSFYNDVAENFYISFEITFSKNIKRRIKFPIIGNLYFQEIENNNHYNIIEDYDEEFPT